MARNRLAEQCNNEYLQEIINKGTDCENFYVFSGIDKTGEDGGYFFVYNKETGMIARKEVANDKIEIFGDKDKSNDKRGYLCIEMCVPYITGVYPADSIYYVDGQPVAVQYTCYIQRIVSAIKCKLEGKQLTDLGEANHMNGLKCDNRLINIEDGSQVDNAIHSAVLNSLLQYKEFEWFKDLFTTTSNKSYTFIHLNDASIISSKWINYFMIRDYEFFEAVTNCKNDLRKKEIEVRYISRRLLDRFMKHLLLQGHWDLITDKN